MKCGARVKNVRPAIIVIAIPLAMLLPKHYAFWQANIMLHGSLRSSSGRVKGILQGVFAGTSKGERATAQ